MASKFTEGGIKNLMEQEEGYRVRKNIRTDPNYKWEFRTTPIYSEPDETVKEYQRRDSRTTFEDILGERQEQFSEKMFHINQDINVANTRARIEQEKKAVRERGKDLRTPAQHMDDLINLIRDRRREEVLALEKFAAEAALSSNPRAQTKSKVLSYAISEAAKSSATPAQSVPKSAFSETKRTLMAGRQERMSRNLELLLKQKGEIDKSMLGAKLVRHLLKRTAYMTRGDVHVARYLRFARDLKLISHGVTRINPMSAVVMEEMLTKKVKMEGELTISDEILFSRETLNKLENVKTKIKAELHKKASKGVTPLERASMLVDPEEYDVLGQRLAGELAVLKKQHSGLRKTAYTEVAAGKVPVDGNNIPKFEKEKYLEPRNIQDALLEMLPEGVYKTDDSLYEKEYSMKEIGWVLEEYLHSLQDKGYVPLLTFDAPPVDVVSNNFHRWSSALGLDPVFPSIIPHVFNRMLGFALKREVDMAGKRIPKNIRRKEKILVEKVEKVQAEPLVLDKYEKYELDVYKRLKDDKYFVHYLDTFMERRADIIESSMSNFPLDPRIVVPFSVCISRSRPRTRYTTSRITRR